MLALVCDVLRVRVRPPKDLLQRSEDVVNEMEAVAFSQWLLEDRRR